MKDGMLIDAGEQSSNDEASEERAQPARYLPEGLLDEDEPLAYDEPMRLARAVATACILVDVTVPACKDRKDEGSQVREQPGDSARAGQPEPVLPDFEAYRRQPLSDAEKRQVEALIALAASYYPQWNRDKESLDDYVTRFRTSPETVRLEALVAKRVKHNRRWRAFLADVQSSSSSNITVQDGTPPFYSIPSYQIVVMTDHPRGGMDISFRLSFLASFYDYYETIRRDDQRLLERRLEPSPEAQAITDLVRSKIAKHYPAYRELPPKLGAALVHSMSTENLLPDDTTLADVLFEDARAW